MPIKFTPTYSITPEIAQDLMRIEASKQVVEDLPVTPELLANLRESARLLSSHYSTQIEGNRLTQKEVHEVLKHEGHFPGRERDEQEVKGYYAALEHLEQQASREDPITEKSIQKLHALVMGAGKNRISPTPYRDGQNVIRDGRTKAIVYLPPESKDVSPLMKALVQWIRENEKLPAPLVAGIAHYQFATVHPYYDGNGRTARLLTTLILHLRGYGLKGIYSLEEYYARNLSGYYKALSVGPSYLYYDGRAEADITPWIAYFCKGMADAFAKAQSQARAAKGAEDLSPLLRKLDPKQRKALELFKAKEVVKARDFGELFGFKARTSSALCSQWVEEGFLIVENSSRKARSYRLGVKFRRLGQ